MTAPPSPGWEHARLIGERLEFDRQGGLRRALRDGFFFVESPAWTSRPATGSPTSSTAPPARGSRTPTGASGT